MHHLNKDALYTRVRDRQLELIRTGCLGGAEIIVNQGGECVLHETFGTNGASGPALEKGMLYRAASMTKPVTAVAVLREVQLGHIDIWAPVSDYLPEFAEMEIGHVENGKAVIDGKAKHPIYVYHLLSHTSGIGSGELGVTQPLPSESVAATAETYSRLPLAFEPGTQQMYSATAAFDVAARIVEVTSGENFSDYVRKYVCEPIGMTDTTFSPTDEQWRRMVVMHGRDAEHKSVDVEMVPGCVFAGIPPKACCAGGGLATTASDYSKFAEMLRRFGLAANGNRILDEFWVNRMRLPHVPESVQNSDCRWGLGVRVVCRDTLPSRLPVGTWGWSGAYGTHFWIDPENDVTAVYMKNSAYDGGAGAMSAFWFEQDVVSSFDSMWNYIPRIN